MGQDSNTILARIGNEPPFRERWAPGKVLALFADTGDEHPETDAYVPVMAKFCAEHDIQFEHLTLDRGYHSPSGSLGLVGKQRKDVAIGSVGFAQSCTSEFKITPIYNYLAEYCARVYGGTAYAKRSLYAYRARHGKLRVIIGFAAGEESRIAKAKDSTCKRCDGFGNRLFSAECRACNGTGVAKPRLLWMQDCVERVCPLAEIGWDRQACQDYFASINLPLPPPSLCFRCMWKSPDELLWSALVYPVRFEEWCVDEAKKLAKYAHLPASLNYGVKGANTTLRAIVNDRYAFYAAKGWTRDRIIAHVAHDRMSHGHCVKSRY